MTAGSVPPMSHPREDAEVRVSTLELFFDLVFVFTITQLTRRARRTSRRCAALLQVVLMLGVIWWMYAGYAWLTNAVAPRPRAPPAAAARRHGRLPGARARRPARVRRQRDRVRRSATWSWWASTPALFAAAPARARVLRHRAVQPVGRARAGAAGSRRHGAVRAVGARLRVRVVHAVSGARAASTSRRALRRAPRARGARRIGESVVAIGVGPPDWPLDAELVGVAVLGLRSARACGGSYFGGDDERAEARWRACRAERRPLLAVDRVRPLAPADPARHRRGRGGDQEGGRRTRSRARDRAGAPARRRRGGVPARRRAVPAHAGHRRRALARGRPPCRAPTIPLGVAVAAAAQIAALVALLAGALIAEPAPCCVRALSSSG